MSDQIDRQAPIEEWKNDFKGYVNALNIPRDDYNGIMEYIDELPSAQPEPLSDTYKRAVWTWLLDYQIKAAELKGRYKPYEVLSWVANDWRKENGDINK